MRAALLIAWCSLCLGASAAHASSHAPCEGGTAQGFPCRYVNLLARASLASFAATGANDIWGWTDPVTGVEYALLGLHQGTAFVDLSDPQNPVHVGTLPTHTFDSTWRDIKVHADHAFIVSAASGHGLQIFDLRQLAATTESPVTFASSAHYDGFGNAHNLAIDEDTGFAYAVGTNSCSGGLHMIDVDDPANPTFAGCYDGDGYTHDAQCVVYAGPDADHQGREICFNSNEDTVTIVDVTDKSAPLMLSRTGYADAHYTHQGWLTEDHHYFFVADEKDEPGHGYNTRTYVFDVSDLDAPLFVGHHSGVTTSTDHNQYVRGNHVFQANYSSGLRVLRLGDLDQAELGEIAYFDTVPENDDPTFVGAWSVYPFFASGVVVVSDRHQGLFVLQPDLTAALECEDGLDNDGDGLRDFPGDPGCFAVEAPVEDPVCDDGADNDGDFAADFPADPGCFAAWDGSEANPIRCGLGYELAFLLPPLLWLRRRKQRIARA